MDVVYDIIRRQIYPYRENLEEQIKKPKKEKIEKAKKLSREQKKIHLKRLKSSKLSDEVVEEFWEKYRSNPLRKVLHSFFNLKLELKLDQNYVSAKHLMDSEAKPATERDNTFKWALCILDTWYPSVAEQVNRAMAISKFFRSLVLVVALIIIFQWIGLLTGLPTWPAILLLLFSFREYIVQRIKSTKLAYQSIVTLFYAPPELQGGKKNEPES